MTDLENKIVSLDTTPTGTTDATEKRVSKRTVSFLGKDKSGERRSGNRGPKSRRVSSEFDQKVLDVRRVARVVAGGRRFSFSVALAAGDRKGRVGVGLGKGADTTLAMDKALKQAKLI